MATQRTSERWYGSVGEAPARSYIYTPKRKHRAKTPKTSFTRYGEIYTPSVYVPRVAVGGWYGAVTYDYEPDILEHQPYASTYLNNPGNIENYLSWIGATSEGSRGTPMIMSRAAPASIQITGEEEVLKKLSHILAAVPERAMKRLEQNCEFILAESQKEVPIDMVYRPGKGGITGGTLQRSGTVEPVPEIGGFQVGYNTPYAAIQHEDMTFHHTRPGAKAKYLEDPAMRIAPTIAADIAEALKEFLA